MVILSQYPITMGEGAETIPQGSTRRMPWKRPTPNFVFNKNGDDIVHAL